MFRADIRPPDIAWAEGAAIRILAVLSQGRRRQSKGPCCILRLTRCGVQNVGCGAIPTQVGKLQHVASGCNIEMLKYLELLSSFYDELS